MSWKKKKRVQGKNKNHSLSKKLKQDKKITEEFEVMMNNLSLEELIGLKLELAAKAAEAAEAAKDAKVRRRAGNKEPRVTLIDLNHDAIRYKRQDMTGIIRRLFGNHLIWWFLPPTKYWHYIGMLSDIRGLLFGKKNLGTAYAYVKAMSLGLAGARAGSPVPFTRKARRRKFRKGLYTRAGYHRKQVGGSR